MKNQKAIICHELGHIVGYILANKSDQTYLGNVILQISSNNNRVEPTFGLYNNINLIAEETRNNRRTIAWIIKGILGCTFQTLFQSTSFCSCWKLNGDGHIDRNNLSWVRTYSHFKANQRWLEADIESIQTELEHLFKDANFIKLVQPTINKIDTKLMNSADNQVVYGESEIDILIVEIENLIPESVIKGYNGILNKWELIFANRS